MPNQNVHLIIVLHVVCDWLWWRKNPKTWCNVGYYGSVEEFEINRVGLRKTSRQPEGGSARTDWVNGEEFAKVFLDGSNVKSCILARGL